MNHGLGCRRFGTRDFAPSVIGVETEDSKRMLLTYSETIDTGQFYRVLKGGWFKGGGYKGSLGNLTVTLGSTGEN